MSYLAEHPLAPRSNVDALGDLDHGIRTGLQTALSAKPRATSEFIDAAASCVSIDELGGLALCAEATLIRLRVIRLTISDAIALVGQLSRMR